MRGLVRAYNVSERVEMFWVVLGVVMLGSTLDVGGLAPDFSMPDTDGNMISLSQLAEKGPVVLAFFPKALPGAK